MATCSNWNDDENGYRVSKLLLDGGGYLKKQLLLQKEVTGTGKTIDDFLADTKTKKTLKKRKDEGKIKDSQYDILYPQNSTPTNLEEWDITLVTFVLTNCCNLNKAEKDAIADIRLLRNTIYGHTATVGMSDQEFHTQWNAISTTLTNHAQLLRDVRCRQHIADTIRTLRTQTLSADQVVDTLKHWRAWENYVELKLDALEGTVGALDGTVGALKGTLAQHHTKVEDELAQITHHIRRKESVDTVTLGRGTRTALNRLQDHREHLRRCNLPVKTRLSTMVTDKLQKNKIVVLTGVRGIGKTHLALNSIEQILENRSADDTELLMLNNPKDIQKVLDPNRKMIVLIDDMLGTRDVNNIELNHWNRFVDTFLTQINRHNILVIITVRKNIKQTCMTEDVKKLFTSEFVFNLDENLLDNNEKEEILRSYAIANDVTLTEDEVVNILASPSCVIGFPYLCNVIRNGSLVSMFERQVESIKEEILELEQNDTTSFVALLMTLFCENRMSMSEINEQTNRIFDEICKYYRRVRIDNGRMFAAAKSLKETHLCYNNEDMCFSFIHETVAEATFEAAKERIPAILVHLCPLSVLIQFLNPNRKASNPLQDRQPEEMSYTLILQRFKESICSTKDPGGTKCIAGSSLWGDDDFVTIALQELDLDLFYQEDTDEQKSLLSYFAGLGYSKQIQRIIENSIHITKEKKQTQIVKAIAEACMCRKKEVVMLLVVETETKVSDEMLFAAVDGGDTNIVNVLLENGGNIEATKPDSGENLLHDVCAKNDTEMLIFFLQRCILDVTFTSLLTSTTTDGLSPLLIAAIKSGPAIFKILSDLGADVEQCDSEGLGCLHYAAMNGNYETVCHICLNHNELIYKTSRTGYTAAHSATGDLKCLEHLLDQGINAMHTSKRGETLLHVAARKGDYDAVIYICEKYDKMEQMKDIDGYSAAHFAAQNGSVNCLKYLLEREGGIFDPMQKTTAGESLLQIACINGNFETMKFLAQKYEAMTQETDTVGINAVQCASMYGSLNCLTYLLEVKGLNPVIKTDNGHTLLHLASLNGAANIVTYICQTYEALIPMIDVDGRNAAHLAKNISCLQQLIERGTDHMTTTSSGESILHTACLQHHCDIVSFIVDKYKDVTLLTNNDGFNAVQYSATCNNVDCLSCLIKHGLDPMVKTTEEHTILHLSALNGAQDVVKYLCENNKQMMNMLDNVGRTAVHYAANIECLHILKENGLDPEKTKTASGESVLHVAAAQGNYEVVLYLSVSERCEDLFQMKNDEGMNAAFYAVQGGSINCLTLLIEQGIKPDSKMNGERTLLHWSSINGNIDILKHLCDKHRELITITDDEDRTAAHYARTVDCLEYLIEQGIDYKTRSKKGETLLHVAAICGNIEIVLYLCDQYKDLLTLTDNVGMSAAHYAAKFGNLDCLTYLLDNGLSPTLKTNEGHSVFKIAHLYERDTIIMYLLKYFKDQFKSSDRVLYLLLTGKQMIGSKPILNPLEKGIDVMLGVFKK